MSNCPVSNCPVSICPGEHISAHRKIILFIMTYESIFFCTHCDRADVQNSKWGLISDLYKRLSYRWVTARCILSVVILPIATQQCRNYLYDKSWPNWWYEVGGLVWGSVSWTMCTQPWRDRVSAPIVSGFINKPTTVELCISPVYWRLAVAKFSKSTM